MDCSQALETATPFSSSVTLRHFPIEFFTLEVLFPQKDSGMEVLTLLANQSPLSNSSPTVIKAALAPIYQMKVYFQRSVSPPRIVCFQFMALSLDIVLSMASCFSTSSVHFVSRVD